VVVVVGALSFISFFKEECFGSQLCFRFHAKKHLIWCTLGSSYSQSLGNT